MNARERQALEKRRLTLAHRITRLQNLIKIRQGMENIIKLTAESILLDIEGGRFHGVSEQYLDDAQSILHDVVEAISGNPNTNSST